MIKLKKLINERKFGEPLPTLKSEMEKHQSKKQNIKEVDFVQSMKDTNLTRIKRSAILYKVIQAAGMSTQQLMADIQKIKKELK